MARKGIAPKPAPVRTASADRPRRFNALQVGADELTSMLMVDTRQALRRASTKAASLPATSPVASPRKRTINSPRTVVPIMTAVPPPIDPSSYMDARMIDAEEEQRDNVDRIVSTSLPAKSELFSTEKSINEEKTEEGTRTTADTYSPSPLYTPSPSLETRQGLSTDSSNGRGGVEAQGADPDSHSENQEHLRILQPTHSEAPVIIATDLDIPPVSAISDSPLIRQPEDTLTPFVPEQEIVEDIAQFSTHPHQREVERHEEQDQARSQDSADGNLSPDDHVEDCVPAEASSIPENEVQPKALPTVSALALLGERTPSPATLNTLAPPTNAEVPDTKQDYPTPESEKEDVPMPTYVPEDVLPGDQKLQYARYRDLHQGGGQISSCNFSPDLKFLAVSSADHSVRIWKLPKFKLVRTLYGHLAGVSAVAWSPCSTLLASGSDDKMIRFWHVPDFKPHRKPLAEHHSYVSCLAFSPKGNILVSGSFDESLIIWSVRSLQALMTLPAHSDPVSAVSFSLDGTLLCSAGGDGLIRLWDPSTGQCLRTLIHEDNAAVVNVSFCPNGRYILSQSLDSCARLWDYARGKGQIMKTYQGHQNKTNFAAAVFGTYGSSSADESEQQAMLCSSSEDGSIHVWDVVHKTSLGVISDAHQGPVFGLDWAQIESGEKFLVSGGADGTVTLWKEHET